MESIFRAADILLPKTNVEKWSVIACDQFTANPDYWTKLESETGDAPSTLKLIVPEARLGQVNEAEESEKIAARMESYLSDGVFNILTDSYIYIEREMLSGKFRRGIVGAVDLDAYDYAPGTDAPVRATEETVESRLPVRVKVRSGAALELPHIMLLSAEYDNAHFEWLDAIKNELDLVYDFDLSAGGGRITGRAISGECAKKLETMFTAGNGEVKLIIGDGNHSLAAAKKHWENIKATLPDKERENHPARFALAELCSVGDEAIELHPIHRVLYNADTAEVSSALEELRGEGGLSFGYICDGKITTVETKYNDAGALTAAVQKVLDTLVGKHAESIDYIHGGKALMECAEKEKAVGIMLPALRRRELFEAARAGRIFPRKCFSIGEAQEKRYYLEARKIRLD